MLDIVIKVRKKAYPDKSEEELHDEILDYLDDLGIIKASGKFRDEVEIGGKKQSGYEAFMNLYPEVGQKSTVAKDRVRDLKKNKTSTKVKLRKSNWKQLKDLWLQLAQRQMIRYADTVNQDAETVARDVFKDADKKIFVLDLKQIVKHELGVDKDHGAYVSETKADYGHHYRTMPYGKFLKQLTLQTDLPVNLLNDLMVQTMREQLGNRKEYINEKTLANLIRTFNNQFNDRIRTSYSYVPLEFSGSTSIYNAKKQEFVDEVDASVLGVYSAQSTVDTKYLYDRPPLRYDSTDPELKILQRTYGDKITVFGKLPKRAIKIPRYDNGTTTPDFIFKIDREDKPVYVIIETKAENMRLGDEEIRTIQKTYFDQLKASGVYYRMATSEDEVHQLINKIENGEIEPDDITN